MMALLLVPGPTIAAGQSLSNAVNCLEGRVVRIITPSGWNKAPLSFQLSMDGEEFHDLYHVQASAGAFTPYEVVVPSVEESASLMFPVSTGYLIAWVKFRSGTSSVPVIQKEDRSFQILLDMPDEPELVVGPTGPQGVAGVAGVAGATGPTGTYNYKGVVDGSEAAAGNIGEVISSSNFGGVNLTTAVPMNVTQIILTPGDWNIGGVVIFTPVSTGPNSVIAALSQTAASLPSDNDVATGKGIMQQIWASSMPAGKTQTTPTSLIRINTASAKPVYLVAVATFGGGSVGVTGYISARRIR
jgi:hypothetical protein